LSTRNPSPRHVAEGKHSISLIFNDRNESMRLAGMQQPLRDDDLPQDLFETTALERAMRGENFTAVDKSRRASGRTGGRLR
jgi:hypothetical protein